MPTTSKGSPYPASTATPDVPSDLQDLADHLDTRVAKLTDLGVVTTSGAGTATVTFAAAFTVAPKVFLSVVSATIPGSVCQAYVGAVTTTTVVIKTHSTAAVGGGALTVNWLAIEF
jgi:hypothetical protein